MTLGNTLFDVNSGVRLGLTDKHQELMPKKLGNARYTIEKMN